MSLNHELRIKALEKKVSGLENLVKEMLVSPEESDFYVKRGFQGFYVYQGEEKVNDRPLKRGEAEEMAAEMNRAAA